MIRRGIAIGVCLIFVTFPVLAGGSEAWQTLKPELYGERAIADGTELMELEIPVRPQNAGMVPVSVKMLRPQSSGWYVKTLTFIADRNPAPVVAVFHLTPKSGIASLLTRIRIDNYSFVRAVAETSDGQLYMVARFVKATGGCSAPAVAGGPEAIAELGKMRLKQHKPRPELLMGGHQIAEVSLNIRHPNHSGFQKDPLKGYFIPPHYVHAIKVWQNGEKILSVDGAISLSEDPMVRFYYIPSGEGNLSVRVEDTEGNVFERSWPLDQHLKAAM